MYNYSIISLLIVLSAGLVTSSAQAQSVTPPKAVSPPKGETQPKALESNQAQIKALKFKTDTLTKELIELKSQRDQLQENRSKVIQKRRQLTKDQDELGVSSESFPEIVKVLQSQRIQLKIDLAGLEARRDWLSASKSENKDSSQAQRAAKKIENLKALVELEEAALALIRAHVPVGDVKQTDWVEAKKRAMLARLKLADAETEAGERSPYHDELIRVSLDRAEKQARLGKIEEMLTEMTKARKTLESWVEADQYVDNLEIQLDRLEALIKTTEIQLLRVRQELTILVGGNSGY